MLTDFTGDVPYDRWLRTVRGPHDRRIRVWVHDAELKFLADLTDLFLDGFVTIDVTAETVYSLDLTLNDPSRSIRFEPDDGDLPIYLAKVIRVWDERWVPNPAGGGDWVACPVFTGPVADFDRDGATVTLRCRDMSWFAMGDVVDGFTRKKDVKVTDVIRKLFKDSGENRLGAVPDLSNRLGTDLQVEGSEHRWDLIVSLAKDLGRVAAYDPRGVPYVRKTPPKPGLRLGDDDVCSQLRIDRGVQDFATRWIVRGPKPKGGRDRIVGHAAIPGNSKASAKNLGRGGEPRVRTEVVDADHIANKREADQRAQKLRDAVVTAEDTSSIDTIPFPNVEPWDLVTVGGRAGVARIRVRQAVLQLVGGPQQIGSRRSVGFVRPGKGHRGGAGLRKDV